MSIYDYTIKDQKGQDVSLSEYKGKVLLIVNTATHCGFTPQYEGLQKLYDKYKERGFVILGFPCNQFASQAPESKGFITRERSKTDERQITVALTDNGMKLRDEAMGIPATVGGCIDLSREEIGTLYQLLYKILEKGAE